MAHKVNITGGPSELDLAVSFLSRSASATVNFTFADEKGREVMRDVKIQALGRLPTFRKEAWWSFGGLNGRQVVRGCFESRERKGRATIFQAREFIQVHADTSNPLIEAHSSEIFFRLAIWHGGDMEGWFYFKYRDERGPWECMLPTGVTLATLEGGNGSFERIQKVLRFFEEGMKSGAIEFPTDKYQDEPEARNVAISLVEDLKSRVAGFIFGQ